MLTHLHVHSRYSLLTATPSIEELVAAATANQMDHLALTDHNALYGAVEFCAACTKADVQPIVGMTLKVQLPQAPAESAPEQFVLLAANHAGYQSLCRLTSLIQASPDRELRAQQGVSWEELKANHQGVIAIAGGRRSWLQRWIAASDLKAANTFLGRFAGLFEEQGYLALELHTARDHAIAQQVNRLAQRFGLPVIAVQPVYTLLPAERPRLRLLAAIDRNCRLEEVPTTALPDENDPAVELHWLSPEDMQQRFAAFPQAIGNIDQVLTACEPALPSGKPIFPLLKLAEGVNANDELTNLAHQGINRLYAPARIESEMASAEGNNADVATPPITSYSTEANLPRQRLQDELTIIARAGYAPLFLVVADIVRFARNQGIPVSTRGSVANSLVAYATGITTVDPLANNLLFERFLNPERGSPPDIDLDFCSERRDEVLEYVRRTYGEDRVALVATVSTMRPRSAIGETAKAYGMDEEAASRLVNMLPDEWHPDPRRRVHSTRDLLMAKLDKEEERQIVSAAYELIGTPHHLSIHPGGVVITPGPMTDFAPVQWTPKGFLIIQFDHEHAEAIGLAKLDLLGIRALTVLATTTQLVRQHVDPAFRLETIPLNDSTTAAMLAVGDTIGVFQCESSGARRTLRQLKARTVADLAVANAFFKPGPATGGMATNFIRRYRGDEPTRYLHPTLEPILGFTKGVLIFQEQVLRVGRQIAGLSWGEADYLRKGMSKFQASAMAEIRTRFIDGCQRISGFSAEQATTLWEQVEAFAGYGFNQGHATAYADVSYRSAWLKAHFPDAFLAARLATQGGFHHPAIYIAEAQRLGIQVFPPHINHSGHGFTLGFAEDNGTRRPVLWMGLGQIQHLRYSAIEEMITERNHRTFTTPNDLRERVALQQREVINLVQCGGLDGLAENRATLLAQVQKNLTTTPQQLAFDFAQAQIEPESASQRLRWEKELLGQPVSLHPLQAVAQRPKGSGKSIATLAQAASHTGRNVQLLLYRLPGWTGGKGFYVSDGITYSVAIPQEKLTTPRSWQPILAEGRWLVDEWGGGWLQVENWQLWEGEK